MSIISTENTLETIIYQTTNAKVIPIPPPSLTTNKHNVSFWDLDNIIWEGKLKIIEQEEYGIDSLKCKIEFANFDNSHWADVWYNDEDIKITDSYKIYSIVVAHAGKRIGLGLVFKESDAAIEFNSTLQDFRKHLNAMNDSANESIDISSLQNNEENFIYQNSDSDDDFGDFISSDNLRK